MGESTQISSVATPDPAPGPNPDSTPDPRGGSKPEPDSGETKQGCTQSVSPCPSALCTPAPLTGCPNPPKVRPLLQALHRNSLRTICSKPGTVATSKVTPATNDPSETKATHQPEVSKPIHPAAKPQRLSRSKTEGGRGSRTQRPKKEAEGRSTDTKSNELKSDEMKSHRIVSHSVSAVVSKSPSDAHWSDTDWPVRSLSIASRTRLSGMQSPNSRPPNSRPSKSQAEGGKQRLDVKAADAKKQGSVHSATLPVAANQFTRAETLILFDWDDTLLPSSWLAERDLSLDAACVPTRQEQSYLDVISESVCQVLASAVHIGRVVVVTNAESGWVDLSAAKFMPRVLAMLHSAHISVISARSEFESPQLQHPVQWKVEAFRHLLFLAYPAEEKTEEREGDGKENGARTARISDVRCPRKNVVSFGDSDSERIALIQCVQALTKSEQLACQPASYLYKSLKLCEHPTPTILQRQLQLVQKLLPQIIHHGGNLDLRVNFKVSASPMVPTRTAPRQLKV